jgi:hypothetical protein
VSETIENALRADDRGGVSGTAGTSLLPRSA